MFPTLYNYSNYTINRGWKQYAFRDHQKCKYLYIVNCVKGYMDKLLYEKYHVYSRPPNPQFPILFKLILELAGQIAPTLKLED